ncbi:MAG: peptide deformylase [Desulfurispora sp.]|uniref:peptide deformylase n=1 Tax=Desulfurispora sp. TaxID=3014275 RepID=UPI00404B1D70
MAVFNVVTEGDEVLREKAVPVRKITSSIHKLLDNMRDTMYAYKGVGLAAPQIGVSKRVIVVDVGEGLWELVNPEIIASQGEEKGMEGCLSIPGVVGDVIRAARVTVTGWNRQGETVTVQAEGFFARALQHEIDHLNGVLFTDKALNIRRA